MKLWLLVLVLAMVGVAAAPEQREQKTWDEALYGIAWGHTYVVDVYDCSEFSRDLAAALRSSGWKARPYTVTVDCGSGLFGPECQQQKNNHMIVHVRDVYIEATTGEVISPKDYKAYGLR